MQFNLASTHELHPLRRTAPPGERQIEASRLELTAHRIEPDLKARPKEDLAFTRDPHIADCDEFVVGCVMGDPIGLDAHAAAAQLGIALVGHLTIGSTAHPITAPEGRTRHLCTQVLLAQFGFQPQPGFWQAVGLGIRGGRGRLRMCKGRQGQESGEQPAHGSDRPARTRT